jgi:hypothetical protein
LAAYRCGDTSAHTAKPSNSNATKRSRAQPALASALRLLAVAGLYSVVSYSVTYQVVVLKDGAELPDCVLNAVGRRLAGATRENE